MNEFIVIAGLSGAGRSGAADILEDLGWFVIDNLPPALIPQVSQLASAADSNIGRVVLVVGTGRYHEEVLPALRTLRGRARRLRLLFLEASTDVLVRRYESTKRRHPLWGELEEHSLPDAIDAERALLEPVKAEADVVVDTSDLNVHQLKARVQELFADEDNAPAMQTTIVTFGYKHGLPVDTDLVMDCRFLPNPYWVEGLREYTGLDQPVKDYVLDRDVTREFIGEMHSLLDLLLPAYVAEGKSYLTLAFGCTGGRHRSVAIAEEIAHYLQSQGFPAKVKHRDIAK